MKHNCDVVRDLMPLCIDHAASEASQDMLREHLTECRDCASAYNDMQNELPREPLEHPAMAEKVKLLQKVRHRRQRRSLLIGLLIGIVAIVGLAMLISENQHWFTYGVSVDDYDLLLSRRANGDVILTRKQYNDQIVGWDCYRNEGRWVFQSTGNWLEEPWPESLRVSSMRADDLIWVEGEGLYEERLSFDEDQGCYVLLRSPVEEIWLARNRPGPDDWTGDELIYTRGDDLPMVSAELEAFMCNEDMYRGTREAYWEEQLQYYTQQSVQDEKSNIYRETRETLMQHIPEWK